jgi:hypothetical protein
VQLYVISQSPNFSNLTTIFNLCSADRLFSFRLPLLLSPLLKLPKPQLLLPLQMLQTQPQMMDQVE